MLARLKAWAAAVRRDVLALFLAARDPRTPLAARLVCLIVAAYALSPIDLIPDFIPVLGYLDDLLIVPLGIILAVRLIPAPLLQELRAEAGKILERPSSRGGAAIVIALWLAVLALGAIWFWRWQNR